MALASSSPPGFVNDMHEACVLGDQEKLIRSLSWARREDSEIRIGDRKSTLLHISAEYGTVSIMETLLSNDAFRKHILSQDHEGDTPLHIATDNIDIFKQLFKVFADLKTDVNDLRNHKRRTLLHYAAGKGNAEVVKFLICKGKANKLVRDEYGATPFHFAARCGDKSVMAMLVGDDVDDGNHFGITSLHYASWNQHIEAVEWLLGRRASLSEVDHVNGNTALHWAVRNGASNVLLKILIQGGADPFVRNKKGELALDIAHDFHKEFADVIKCICTEMSELKSNNEHDLSIYTRKHKDGATLIHYAASCFTKQNVEWLFEHIRRATPRGVRGKDENFKATVNCKDNNGNNAFHWAAMEGNIEVIEMLQKYNVDPLQRNSTRQTPLWLALSNNHLEFGEKLMKCLGKHLDVKMWEEDTSSWADTFNEKLGLCMGMEDLCKQMPPIYKLLCAGETSRACSLHRLDRLFSEQNGRFVQRNTDGRGGDVNEKGKVTGRTALHWATIRNQKDIVSILCNTEELSKDLVADVKDLHDMTPLDYATDVEIMRELHKRQDVKSHVEVLYRDRQAYVHACNAILVGAALIATVSFNGLLHPPLIDAVKYFRRYTALRVFWVMDSLSFAFSIATVLAAAYAVLPLPYNSIAKAVTNIRWALSGAVFFLAFSILFVFSSFAAAGFAVLPRRYWKSHMLTSVVLGAVFCVIFIGLLAKRLCTVHSQARRSRTLETQIDIFLKNENIERPFGFIRRSIMSFLSKDQRRPSLASEDGNQFIAIASNNESQIQSSSSNVEGGTRHDYLSWDDRLDEICNESRDREEDTPLHIATDNIDIFKELFKVFVELDSKIDVNDLRNHKRQPLLHCAAGKDNAEVVKFLICKGKANKLARDEYGAIPFHFAARCEDKSIMAMLVGGDVDDGNYFGITSFVELANN